MNENPNARDDAGEAAGAPPPTSPELAVRLSGNELLEHVTVAAAERVDIQVRSREERRYKALAIGVTVLGVLGLGTLTWVVKTLVHEEVKGQLTEIHKEVEEKTSEEVEASVRASVRDLQERLQQEVAYQQLSYMALSLDMKKTGFSHSERDAAMDLIRQLAPDEIITSRPEFIVVIEKILDKFAGADLAEHIEEMDDCLRERLSRHQGCVFTLVNHYGMHVVGDPSPQKRLPRFTDYVTAAHKHRYPELATLWSLLYEFKQSNLKRTPKTEELLQFGLHLANPEDSERFLKQLARYSSTKNWQNRPTPEGKEVERVVTALMEEHPELKKKLDDVVNDTEAETQKSP